MADEKGDSKNIGGINVKITADTKDFNAKTRSVKQALSALAMAAGGASSDSMQLTATLLEIQKSISKVESSVRAATAAITQTSTALSAIGTNAGGVEKAAADMTTISDTASAAAPAVESLGGAAEKAAADLEKTDTALKDAEKDIKKTEESTEGLSKETDGLSDSLGDTEKKAKKASKEIDGLGKEYDDLKDKTNKGDLFQSLKMGAITIGIGKLLKDSVTIAGDLEQNIGGAESVFKSYAGTIRETAKTAAENLGLAESDYLATATKMGALFQGTGMSAAKSADMTAAAMQRAADVASIMGIRIDDAMYSIAGAAKGNFTMMDNLGVAINDTTLQVYAQEKGLGKLETTQQKVNAAMEMFMEKTEYAAGNYAKENDTYAGSLNTLKAEFKNFMTEAGTTLIPTVTAGIKFLSGVLQDISPIVIAAGNGLGLIGDTLALIPEPVMKTATYVLTAGIAFKKLNTVLGVTGSRLALIATLALLVLGKLKEASTTNEEIVSDASENAADSIGIATDAQDDMTDSVKETGKALKSLAGFDEITKLSGGSTGLSLVSDSDFQDVEDYSEEIADVESKFGELDNSAAVVFGNIAEYWGEVWSLITSGDWEGVLKKLGEGMNSFLTDIFGEGWTKFRQYWEDIGAKIASGDIKGALSTMFESLDELTGGFFSKGIDKFDSFIEEYGKEIELFGESYINTIDGYLGAIDSAFGTHFSEWYKEFNTFWRNVGANLYEITHADEIKNIDLTGKYSLGTLQQLATDKLREGASVTEAREFALSEYLTTSEAVYWYENVLKDEHKLSEENLERWQSNLINSGQLSEDFSSKAVYDAVTAANASNNGVTEIHTTFEVDGEKLGESVTSYQNGMAYRQNGR